MKPWIKAAVLSLAAIFAGAPARAAEAAAPAYMTPRLEANGDIAIGNPDAAVTVIEYASLTCPHCARFEQQVFPAFKKVYVESGKVRFVYRPFPLDGADILAFTIARCAAPARFFDFVHFLYLRQAYWVNESFRERLTPFAKGFGVSPEALAACEADKAAEEALLKRVMEARQKYGVTGTPTFIVNDVNVASGEVKPEVLGKFVDEALYKKP